MKIRLAGKIESSTKNGTGLRKVIFAQGCNHNCKGCFNQETHDINGGKEFDTSEIINLINNDFIINGVTFSGGDPFEQAEAFSEIAKNISLNVWCYTGYTFEYIMENKDSHSGWNELINNIDVLLDGKFDINKKDSNLQFRGSSNQRIIDVKQSLKNNRLELYNITYI